MTTKQLKEFINLHKIEWNFIENENETEIYLFIPFDIMMGFNYLFEKYDYEDGIECYMHDGYFTFPMLRIIESYGIDIEEIFYDENGKLNKN